MVLTFKEFRTLLQESLTRRQKEFLKKYPKLQEKELEAWVAVDPTGEKGINVGAMLKLAHAKKIKSPQQIAKLIKEIPNPSQTLPWILKQIAKDEIHLEEDEGKLKDILTLFYAHKDKGYWKGSKDLLQFQTFSELAGAVLEVTGRGEEAQESTVPIYPGTEHIETRGKYTIVKILPTREGCKSFKRYKYGDRPDRAQNAYGFWCIDTWETFRGYLSNASQIPKELIGFYVIFENGRPIYVFDFWTGQFEGAGHQAGGRNYGRNHKDYKLWKDMIAEGEPAARFLLFPQQFLKLAQNKVIKLFDIDNGKFMAETAVKTFISKIKQQSIDPSPMLHSIFHSDDPSVPNPNIEPFVNKFVDVILDRIITRLTEYTRLAQYWVSEKEAGETKVILASELKQTLKRNNFNQLLLDEFNQYYQQGPSSVKSKDFYKVLDKVIREKEDEQFQ